MSEGAKRSLDDLSKDELLRFIHKLKDSHSQLKLHLTEATEGRQKAEEQASELKKKLLDLIPKTKEFQVSLPCIYIIDIFPLITHAIYLCCILHVITFGTGENKGT